jgi:hypothetical protein
MTRLLRGAAFTAVLMAAAPVLAQAPGAGSSDGGQLFSAVYWVDALSLSFAVVFAIGRAMFLKQKILSRGTALGMCNGIVLVPLGMLVISTYSDKVLTSVIQSNRVVLSLAAVVALFTIVEDALPAIFRRRSKETMSILPDGGDGIPTNGPARREQRSEAD